jgi:2-keto-4-pentenoate hydratase/2-oxohepta-3-ene-1,7-dioic acid hydratase in catechol pathway
MRLANLNGRATVVTTSGLFDLATSSNGAFSSSIDKCLPQLEKIRQWFDNANVEPTEATTDEGLIGDPRLGSVVEHPQQIFCVGLNYKEHAKEMDLAIQPAPMIFTKFVSALAGPNADVPIPAPTTDFEAELVVVFGKTGRNIAQEDALSYVAGYCVGQDYSERTTQTAGSPAQFSLGKSFRNFAPIGPWLTTADEIPNPNDLGIRCTVNGTRFQDSNTDDMIFSIPELISYISSVVEIRCGDIMFTGSPHGVGQGQNPKFFLEPGFLIETSIEYLGTIVNKAVRP